MLFLRLHVADWSVIIVVFAIIEHVICSWQLKVGSSVMTWTTRLLTLTSHLTWASSYFSSLLGALVIISRPVLTRTMLACNLALLFQHYHLYLNSKISSVWRLLPERLKPYRSVHRRNCCTATCVAVLNTINCDSLTSPRACIIVMLGARVVSIWNAAKTSCYIIQRKW